MSDTTLCGQYGVLFSKSLNFPYELSSVIIGVVLLSDQEESIQKIRRLI